jgi:myosin heavy subunit
MAANELLAVAERLINANATPEVSHRYFELKNQILFGSLAEPIARYQKDNLEMRKTIDRLQQEQAQDLASWVRFEMLRVFSQFGQLPAGGDDLCTWAFRTVQKAEAQTRIEIQRCKSNRAKMNLKIERLREEPHQSETRVVRVSEQRAALEALRVELSEKKKQLRQIQCRNKKLSLAGTECRQRADGFAKKRSAMADKKTQTEEKRNELKEIQERLVAEVKKVSDDVRVMKVAQRFGRSAVMSSNRPRIDLIMTLKAEIEALRREKEELDAKKKVVLVEAVRTSQKNAVWRSVRMDM